MQQYAKLWKGGLPDVQGWLGRHGWRTQLDDRASVSATYGRAPAGSSSGGFITATRPVDDRLPDKIVSPGAAGGRATQRCKNRAMYR